MNLAAINKYMGISHQIGPDWTAVLSEEFEKTYFNTLMYFIQQEYTEYKVHPKATDVFAAYRVPPSKVKVLMIGQDPYPNDNAHGLAFSSQKDRRPVSLQYIFKEIYRDLELKEDIKTYFPHNNLSSWVKQGVMLLNSVLTVKENMSNSHKGKGWEQFVKATIRAVIKEGRPIAVVAWGKDAQSTYFDAINDLPLHKLEHVQVFTAGHPATAAYGKDLFSGNKHFSKINNYLSSHQIEPIVWTLPPQ